MNTNTKRIVLCGLLTTLAYVSLYFIRIPIIPAATFLRFDVKDVFIALMGILFGPIYAFGGAICVSLLQMISVSEYGIIGLIMNIISATAFTIPISFGYKWKNNNKGLIVGLIVGCITMIATMLLWNYLITPLYMGVTREVVKIMIIPVFLPFNAIKGIINSIFIVIVYNALRTLNIMKLKNEKLQ